MQRIGMNTTLRPVPTVALPVRFLVSDSDSESDENQNGYCTHLFPILESVQCVTYLCVTQKPMNLKQNRNRKLKIGRAVGIGPKTFARKCNV